MNNNENRILIIDAEYDRAESCRGLLADAGYEVVICQDDQSAIEALAKETFASVLLDIDKSSSQGIQLLKHIRQSGQGVNTIVYSTETSFGKVTEAFRSGAFDYLKTPFQSEQLLNTLSNAIEKKLLECNLKKLRSQLERSERLHRFMVESSPDIIFIVDKNGLLAFVNQRAEELLGYSQEELIGQHYSSIVAPESRDAARYYFMERRTGERATRNAEVWLKCKPGEQHKYFERDKLALELNAVGVYEYEEGDKQNQKAAGENRQPYSGTYVVARDVTERRASEKLIQYQAYHDLLTGLPNRALFMDRLQVAIRKANRESTSLVIMFLDLDRFKAVNDTLGHSMGDRLLQEISARLKQSLRESDTLARFGGDEFVVLLSGLEKEVVVKKVAEKIISAVNTPFHIDGHEILVTASIGISIYPQDGNTPEELIKNSDIAMYHTKDEGKNGYNIYENYMSQKQQALTNIESEIRKGIRERQFAVYYQPQVDSENDTMIGVEALLRWQHPDKGMLTPAYFLDIAEQTGQIMELGDWVLETALGDLQAWRQSGDSIGKLSVNYSAKQVEAKDFADRIISALQRFDLPAEILEIEIRESSLLRELDRTIPKLLKLHNAGVQIAIDDFGTGYSSLSLLKKVPVNRLKIDRSFVKAIVQGSDMSIVEAIVHMAKGLKLDMVAEGVEEVFQLQVLQQLDCQIMQGFIYSQGLPAAEVQKLISESGTLPRKSPPDSTKLKAASQLP